MATVPSGGGRAKRDKQADAARAAIAVVDDGVTIRDATARFRIGAVLLNRAIAKLRAERPPR